MIYGETRLKPTRSNRLTRRNAFYISQFLTGMIAVFMAFSMYRLSHPKTDPKLDRYRQLAAEFATLPPVPPEPAAAPDSLPLRLAAGDGIEVRQGPGRIYPMVSNLVLRGDQPLFVAQEAGNWLRIRQARSDIVSAGWVYRFSTRPPPGTPPDNPAQTVTHLKEDGLLIEIFPQLGQADIDTEQWKALDPATRDTIGRFLASCSQSVDAAGHAVIELLEGPTATRLDTWRTDGRAGEAVKARP